MGGQKGQSTITIEKWPAFLDNALDPNSVPGLPKLYVAAAKEVRSFYDTTLLSNVTIFNNIAQIVVAQVVEETDGISRLNTRGRNGNTTIAKAKTLVTDVVDGKYLPGDRAEFQDALSDINTKPDDAFTNEFRTKLGASLYVVGDPAPDNLAQSLTSGSSLKYRNRIVDRAYLDNYSVERRHQHEVLYPGKDYALQSVYDAEAVRRAGMYQREYEQSKLDDAYRAQMEFTSNKIRAVEVFGNSLRTMIGSQASVTQPYYRPSPAGSIIGGALVGAQAGAVFGPWGAAGGAVIGGILGGISAN